MAGIRGTIIKNGWAQGKAFAAQDVPDELQDRDELGRKQKYIFVVLPYSCAVVSGNTELEPTVELLRFSLTDNERPAWKHTQNPRQLCLPVRVKGSPRYCVANIKDRFFLEKSIFTTFLPNPDFVFEQEAIDQLAFWMAKRYTRVAFKDRFNELYADPVNELRELLQSIASDPEGIDSIKQLVGVFIKMVEDDSALFDFKIVFKSGEPSQGSARKYKEIREFIEDNFASCEGYEFEGVEVVSQFDIPYGAMQDYMPLEYDHISFEITDVE